MFHSSCPQGTRFSSSGGSRSSQVKSHHFTDGGIPTRNSVPHRIIERCTRSRSSFNISLHTHHTNTTARPSHSESGLSSPVEDRDSACKHIAYSSETSVNPSTTTRRSASCGVVVAALVFNATQAAKALPSAPEPVVISASKSLLEIKAASLTGASPTARNSVGLEAESSAMAPLTHLQPPSTPGSSVNTATAFVPTAANRPLSAMSSLNPRSSPILAPPSQPPPTPGLLSPSVKRATGKYYVETRASQAGCIFCKIAANSHKPGSPVIYQNDRMIVLPDIHPAAARHLLIIPRSHIANTECLEKEDTELLTEMLALGHSHLAKEQSTGVSPPGPVKIGYHQPPWRSVDHLHQHCFVLPHDPWWKVFKYAVPTVWIPATRLIEQHQ